jgi:hypothetical protein
MILAKEAVAPSSTKLSRQHQRENTIALHQAASYDCYFAFEFPVHKSIYSRSIIEDRTCYMVVPGPC